MNKQLHPQSGTSSGRTLAQILIVFVVLLILVNIPINDYGIGLAHLAPDGPSIVIQEGMLLQGSGPDVYLLEDHKLRRVSSPEAYQVYFRDRRSVNRVEQELLAQFAHGRPIRHWISCRATPLIYALENGQKRLCPDGCGLANVPGAGRARSWDKVRPVACKYLHALPDGPPLSAEDVALLPK
jgi:hypothetical protein